MCADFDSMIGSEDAAESTSKINFMLVQVLRDGKPLCQILEGPGEYYFSPEKRQASFPRCQCDYQQFSTERFGLSW